MLHDAGKFGERFQARLHGKDKGVDHWSVGALLACQMRKWDAWAAALAIEGHHIGIKCGLVSDIRSRLSKKDFWATKDAEALTARFKSDGLIVPDRFLPLVGADEMGAGKNVSLMLCVRMLFSALVDADFLATELHFDGAERPEAPSIDAPLIEELVERELESLGQSSNSIDPILRLRQEVGNACRSAAEQAPGIFTLSAPTGSGKTLALLLFAARHARLHKKRRIIVALPYLTITDQTVKTYTRVLKPWLSQLPEGAGLLEHHSLAGPAETKGADIDLERRRELHAENWDSPVIVTTTVQLLESLFSNRPGACRKLHRLANSILLLDEVQTIPTELAVPTLAALSHLAERFQVTSVLATATQPAFSHLHESVAKFARLGWEPKEICPPQSNLYARTPRYRIDWLARDGDTSDEQLIESLLGAASQGGVLLIANLKRQALRWYRLLASRGLLRLDYMSTNMTPTHRRRVLNFWEGRENTRNPNQILVTTQCVEAGVDLDFPTAFRAFAPLDSMAQAAGRVNRNGLLESGRLVVFHPSENQQRYPEGSYGQAADEASILLKQRGWPADLESPDLFKEYFTRLYKTRGTAERKTQRESEFDGSLDRFDFPKIAELFRLIPGRDAVNVLCPDDPEFETLCAAVRDKWLNAKWVRRARLHAVNLFKPQAGSVAWNALEPVLLNYKKELSGDWFILTDRTLYDEKLGLQFDRIDPGATIA